MIDGYGGGHHFVAGVCDSCGRRLLDLRGVTHADAGKLGIAHSGTATTHEIDTINELIAKMDKVFNNVMGF